jgi:hypothetical protein
MSARGTDPDTERRKTQPVERLSGFWKFADDYATGAAEVLFLGLPAMVWLTRTRYEPASTTFAALVGMSVLALGVALGGGEWLAFNPPWPGWNVPAALFRFGHHNLSIAGLGIGGGYLDATLGSAVLTVVVVASVAATVVALFPRSYALTTHVWGRLRDAHRYLFGPTEPPQP